MSVGIKILTCSLDVFNSPNSRDVLCRVTVNYSMPQTVDYLDDPDHARSHRIVAVNHSAPAASIGIDGDGNAIFKGNVTLEDGGSISLQEDITFTGATGVNQIKFPDNLPNALAFQENANIYQQFITTNGSEAVYFAKDVGVGTSTPNLTPYDKAFTVSGGVSGDVVGALEVQGARTTDAVFGAIAFYYKTNRVGIMEGVRAGADNSGSFAFWTASAGVLGKRVVINKDGNTAVGGTPVIYANFVTLTVGDNSASKIGLLKFRSSYNSGNGAEIYQDTSGKTYFNINSTTIGFSMASDGNIGAGVAPDVNTRLYASNNYTAGLSIGLIGRSNGANANANWGVYATAINSSGDNHHFQDSAGNNSDAGGWNDVSDPARKALIRNITAQQIEQMYNELDNCHIKSCRYRGEMIIGWEKEKGYVDEFDGRETGLRPIYGLAEDAPERFSFMANDPDLPEFLRTKDGKSIGAGRIAVYDILMTQHHKELIKELKQRVEVLEGI